MKECARASSLYAHCLGPSVSTQEPALACWRLLSGEAGLGRERAGGLSGTSGTCTPVGGRSPSRSTLYPLHVEAPGGVAAGIFFNMEFGSTYETPNGGHAFPWWHAMIPFSADLAFFLDSNSNLIAKGMSFALLRLYSDVQS